MPAFVPRHVPLAEAARIARRHGFVLRSVSHDGEIRIVMQRPGPPPNAPSRGAACESHEVSDPADSPDGSSAE